MKSLAPGKLGVGPGVGLKILNHNGLAGIDRVPQEARPRQHTMHARQVGFREALCRNYLKLAPLIRRHKHRVAAVRARGAEHGPQTFKRNNGWIDLPAQRARHLKERLKPAVLKHEILLGLTPLGDVDPKPLPAEECSLGREVWHRPQHHPARLSCALVDNAHLLLELVPLNA